ncbi:histidine phosphatase family protein [uncultured Tateyamaria sp.]|uniref:SixA phosphatase family protein n=1 Tax=uncultured Tateyamaria sp. TaxID=455651 RepID=UPI00261BF1BE|nr:histidine phosphatase family protein [uncultured Tateyamaria sp.]
MTRTLILMRHAKSSWDDPHLADIARPLNRRGQASATAMGAWLCARGYVPDAAVSSNSTRTAETFEALELDCTVTFTKTLYHAGPDAMMTVLRGQEAASVLMLGHNPGIAEFADRLVTRPPAHPRFADYPTCATCIIRFDAGGWNDIGWHEGQPIDFAIPRELMR